MTHVAGLCGSLREQSKTRVALRRALSAAEAAGATTALLDLREFDLPVFDADERQAGDSPEIARQLRRADSIILATPMYHGSYASPIKTALDYCGFDEFENKTVGLLAVSGGSFPITALEHLRSVCRALNAWVLPHQAAIPNARQHVEGETITDEGLDTRLEKLGQRMVQFANIEPDPASFESGQNVGAVD